MPINIPWGLMIGIEKQALNPFNNEISRYDFHDSAEAISFVKTGLRLNAAAPQLPQEAPIGIEGIATKYEAGIRGALSHFNSYL